VTDDEARRRSVRTIVAACGVLTTAPLAGTAFVAGSALHRVDCGGSALPVLGSFCIALAAASTVAAALCVAAVIRTQSRAG
jgi:hypothetical protein